MQAWENICSEIPKISDKFDANFFPFQFYLPIHSYGQKIVYPWSFTGDQVFDWRELHEMAQTMARAVQATSGDVYEVVKKL